MHGWVLTLGILMAVSGAAEKTQGPLPADKAAQAMILPEGFTAEVFAAEPDVVQPISFCSDDRGRLIVAEAFNYGAWQATGKDRVVILEDTDGDGRADSRKVFYEGLNYITGIEVGFGGVWVMSPPSLYFIPDRDGDDKPDVEPIVLFDGFGHKESRHNLANGFTWGPDGWLYAGHGRTSPSDIGRPGTPKNQRIHCDGGVYRIHPVRALMQRDAPLESVFENFADGTTNPWGVDFDDFGQCFVSNCVNPHLFHMIQGGHYEPWRNRPSSLYAYERLPTCADHLHYHSGKPNEIRGETAETLAMGGGHAHCGTLVYLGDRFPESYRNTVFMCNVHGRRINNDILKRHKSGYLAGHGKDFMISADPWFMGVTLRTGPDGNVFVSDWSDTGECHTYRPNKENGRIYKIRYGKAEKIQVDVSKKSDAELVQLQLHKNDWYVRHSRRLLQERASQKNWKKEASRTALLEILNSRERTVPQRLRALWALHVIQGLTSDELRGLLDDRNEHVRAWVIQLLCEGKKPGEKELTKFEELATNDPSPVVRLYLACALQRLPSEQRRGIAERLLKHEEDIKDANLPLMYWYGIEPLIPLNSAKAGAMAEKTRIPLVRQFIARRMVDDVLTRETKDGLQPLVSALSALSDADRIAVLAGMREGLRGRKSMEMPSGWPNLYAELARSEDAGVREYAGVLAVIFGDPQALVELKKTALSKAATPSERTTALDTLIDKRIPDLATMLQELLDDKAVRRPALRGLATVPHASTPTRILSIYPEMSAEEKNEAVATLASRKDFALELLRAIEKKNVPRTDISAYAARQINALGDKQITEMLGKAWGEVRSITSQKQELIARYKTQLTPNAMKNANAQNGRAVFAKTCQQCHKLFGEGGTIGPDLTGANRNDLEYLLSNLIDPSAEVARDYRMSRVETRNGRVVTGMILERTPKRLVLQTADAKLTFAQEDIELVEDSSFSIMPEGMLEQLTKEQVRDLMGYLMAKHQGG